MKTDDQNIMIMFIGKPRSGKDHVAQVCADRIGTKKASCSDVIYRGIAESLIEDHEYRIQRLKGMDFENSSEYGNDLATIDIDKLTEAVKQMPKELIRPLLISKGDYSVRQMGSDYLVRKLYEDGVRIVTGIRRPDELKMVRAFCSSRCVKSLVIWLSRIGYENPEDNTAVCDTDADICYRIKEGDIDRMSGVISSFVEGWVYANTGHTNPGSK